MKITIQDARTAVTLQKRDFRVTISGARGPAGPQGDPGEGGEWGTIVGDITEQTDLYNALQAKVPYTGATQDVNLGEYGAQLGNLEFDNTPTNMPTTAGSVYWNDTDGTLNLVLKGGQTISRIGETQHIRALNNTGAQIARGKVVYVVGAQGQRLTIALADADTEILSKDTIGFTAEAIADGAEGFVIVQGVINNVSTTGMTDGATVYLSQTAGGYTTTTPTDPAHLVVLGFIVNGGSGGAGSIYVKVDNGYELEELHGVADAAKVTPVGADALLLRDSEDNNLWKRLTWTNALAGVKSHMDTFKSVAGGYASLDGSGKVPASELPSYVDDVVEVANYAALPGTGETGKIYVTLDTNKCYRWTGSVYVEVSAGGGVDTLTTTGTSGAATLVGSTLNIPQYQGVLTNPVTGTGTAGQVAYFSGTSAVTGSSAFLFSPTSELDLANSISASSAIARGARIRPTLIASANNDVLVGLDIAPTFTAGAFTGVSSYGLRSSSADALIRNFVISNGQINYQGTNTSIVGFSSQFFITNSAAAGIIQLQATGATGTIRFSGSGPTEYMRLWNGGNLLLQTGGTFTDTGARLTVRGSGTTSATTALLIQNSTPTALLTVRDDGRTIVNSAGGLFFTADVGLNVPSTANPSMQFISFGGSSSGSLGSLYRFNPAVANGTITSGIYNVIGGTNGFTPTSGTGQFIWLNIDPTINQTGGANGITRGLYVNPTLTAAADWRGIESVAASNANHTLLKLRNATVDVLTVKADSKIGLWNATPVAQPTTAIAEATFVENSGGTAVNVDSTFAGYTIQQIAQALKDIGILA